MQSKLTFIIVTYNSAEIIKTCLQKIYDRNYDIIISDNNSRDNTVEIIKKDFPKVKIIKSNKNLGYARANNIAFANVDTEFTAILNPDCFIDKESIVRILAVMDKDKNIAISGALSFGGNIDKKNGEVIATDFDQIAKKNFLSEEAEFYTSKFISGCFMLCRSEIFYQIGLFNSNFFMYCEDNEICKRVVRNGYKIITVKNTKQIHLSRKSSKIDNTKLNHALLWHRFGFSKCYYTEYVHNKFIAKLKAVRNIIKVLFKSILGLISFQKISLKDKAILDGAFCYLIGLGAFDTNDNPRKVPIDQ